MQSLTNARCVSATGLRYLNHRWNYAAGVCRRCGDAMENEMTDKSWKAEERRIAVRLNTTRNPSNGRRQADIDAGLFAIECKKTKAMPTYVRDRLEQAATGAKAGQLPILIVSHAAGRGQKIERYVTMDWEAFLIIFDAIQEHEPGDGGTVVRMRIAEYAKNLKPRPTPRPRKAGRH